MPKRELEFQASNSSKFWSIELKGLSHVVEFGRTGTAGQTKKKAFASKTLAQKSFDSLVNQKLRKGYVDVNPASASSKKPKTSSSKTTPRAKATSRKPPKKTAKTIAKPAQPTFTKKLEKEFVQFIQRHEADKAAKALEKSPELARITYRGTPTRFQGQTMLQIAVRHAAPKIANLLVEHNADVNFIDSPSASNDWTSPVLNDAIHTAVGIAVGHDARTFKAFFEMVRRLLESGADPNQVDSRGKNAYRRFVQTLHPWTDDVYFEDNKSSRKQTSHLRMIHGLLVEFGATTQDLETLPILQRKRAGLEDFKFSDSQWPERTWGFQSFENESAMYSIAHIVEYSNVAQTCNDSLEYVLGGCKTADGDQNVIATAEASAISGAEVISILSGNGSKKDATYYFGTFLDGKPKPSRAIVKRAIKVVEQILQASELHQQWDSSTKGSHKWKKSVANLHKRLLKC